MFYMLCENFKIVRSKQNLTKPVMITIQLKKYTLKIMPGQMYTSSKDIGKMKQALKI